MSRHTITELLEEYVYTHQETHISVEELVSSIGDRGHGLLLLMLALPNVLLLASFPGISTFLGIPICFIAIQLIMHRSHPWLPQRIRYSQLQRETLLNILRKAAPYLLKIERYIKPRWMFMTQKSMEHVLGIFILVLGIIIALPIPFGNFFGGLGVVILSLALIEKDGVFAAVGMALTMILSFVIFKIAGSLFGFFYNLF